MAGCKFHRLEHVGFEIFMDVSKIKHPVLYKDISDEACPMDEDVFMARVNKLAINKLLRTHPEKYHVGDIVLAWYGRHPSRPEYCVGYVGTDRKFVLPPGGMYLTGEVDQDVCDHLDDPLEFYKNVPVLFSNIVTACHEVIVYDARGVDHVIHVS